MKITFLQRESRKVECVEDGTEMSLKHFKVHPHTDHRGHHHRARQLPSIHGNSETDTEFSTQEDQIQHIHYVGQNQRERKFRRESLNYIDESDEDNGNESDDEEDSSDDNEDEENSDICNSHKIWTQKIDFEMLK